MDRFLVFFDGSVLMADQSVIEEAKKYGRDTIVVGESGYKLSAISKNLSMKDYFEQYPEKRPEVKNEFVIEDERYKNMTPEEIEASDKRRQEGLLRGLKRFIDEQSARGITALNALKIYEYALKKGNFNKDVILQTL